MTSLMRRWRLRTRRVERLRAMVHAYRCPKCKAWDWLDLGEHPADLFYSNFVHVYECRSCGWEVWDR